MMTMHGKELQERTGPAGPNAATADDDTPGAVTLAMFWAIVDPEEERDA